MGWRKPPPKPDPEPYLGDSVPPDPKPFPLPPAIEDHEMPESAWAVLLWGYWISALVAIAVVVWLLWPKIIGPAAAQVAVLPECVELARRENFPTDFLSKDDLRRAKRRMLWLEVRHPFDPMVRDCRRAIRRAEQAIRN